MNQYNVKIKDFYGRFPPLTECEAPISELVGRYNIRDKKIISVGGGKAHEEYWFTQAGNKLTIFDIDEDGDIEPVLSKLTINAKTHDDGLFRYNVGDFTASKTRDLQNENLADVLYFSSFTPDELRRSEIQRNYLNGTIFRLMTKGYLLTTRKGWLTSEKAERYFPRNSWPSFRNPFHPIVLKATDELLKAGGLFVLQSYCGGVDIKLNANYIKCVQKNLKKSGLTLLEVYNLKSSPAVLLMTAVKSPEATYLINPSEEIKSFHGRSPLSREGIEIQYSTFL